jgi:hypothetical protein
MLLCNASLPVHFCMGCASAPRSIAVRLNAKISFFAPKGLRHKAQGCGESRYPGTLPIMIFNPNGVV